MVTPDADACALLMSTSILPNSLTVCSTTFLTTLSLSAPAFTSAWTARTLIPYLLSSSAFASSSFLTLRPVSTRLAPSLAYAVAIPYPMDPQLPSLRTARPPPVIIAVLPVKKPICVHSFPSHDYFLHTA